MYRVERDSIHGFPVPVPAPKDRKHMTSWSALGVQMGTETIKLETTKKSPIVSEEHHFHHEQHLQVQTNISFIFAYARQENFTSFDGLRPDQNKTALRRDIGNTRTSRNIRRSFGRRCRLRRRQQPNSRKRQPKAKEAKTDQAPLSSVSRATSRIDR